ncbi:hypothetical protein H2203_000683 [Taxawa tesnikishii (nom. ined.)]|nr:hypothetical protein H2203_000683 [Dothideales sp. JES 119]
MLHPLSILYLTFLLTQLYALTLHFPRPRAGLVHPRSFQLLKLCTGVAALASWQPVLNLSPTAPLAATLPPSLCLLASEALFAWTAHAARPGKLALIYGRVTPRYVVADGPFAYVRHPTYASYWTGWLGVLAAAVVGARWPGYVLRAWLGPRVRAVVLATCLVELGWCYWAAAYLEEVQFWRA